MTVLRQEFQISVEGADAAAAALGRTAAAMNGVNEAAIRDRIAIGDAEQAIVKKIRAEQAHRQAIEDVLKPTTEAVKQNGFLAKAASSASGALTLLRKAAEVIPGVELGTILAAAAAGVYALYKAFGPATGAADEHTAALTAQAVAVRDLAAAHRELLRGQIGAGAAGAKKALDLLGPGATPEAIDAVIRLSAQRNVADMAQAEAIQRSVRKAGGLSPVSDAEQKRIESLQGERNKLIDAAEKRDDGGAYSLSYKDRLALSVTAQAFQREIDKIRNEAQGAAGWKLGDVVSQTTADLARLDAELNKFGVGSSPGRPERSSGSGRASTKAPGAWWRDSARAMMDAADEERARKNRERDFTGPGFAYPRSDDEKLGAGSFGGYQPEAAGDRKAAEEARAVLNLASAWDYLGASMGGTVGRMAQSASDIGSIVTQSVGALTGALGAAATNMIIAGDAGAKGLKKQAGNALAGISAQAFGYAALLTAFGAAAAIPGVGLILGMNAPGFFAAAGVMAGAGLGLAGAARALGADKIGAGSGGGNTAAAGTPAPVGAGSSGPGMAGQTAPLELHVYMGGDEVHDLTYRTARRREMSGSMSMPRVGVAT